MSVGGCVRTPVWVCLGAVSEDSRVCPSGVVSGLPSVSVGGCVRTPVWVCLGAVSEDSHLCPSGVVSGLPCVSIGGLYQDSRLGPSGVVSGLPSGSARGRIRGPLSVSTGETYQRTPQGPAVLPPSPGAPLPPGAVWDQAAMLPGGPVVACGPLWVEAWPVPFQRPVRL